MAFLESVFTYLVDRFSSFYDKLNETGQLVFWIVVILFVVLFILLIIVLQQKSIAKKLDRQYANRIRFSETKNESANKSDTLFDTTDMDVDLENEKTRNLKEITDKLQAVIDSKTIPLTNYEEDQEESSIISYKELMNRKSSPLDSTSSMPKETKVTSLTKDIDRTYLTDEKPKFKSSDFISPIFGVQNDLSSQKQPIVEKPDKQHETLVKKTYQVEELDFSTSAEDEYLNSLKQFRNNLN